MSSRPAKQSLASRALLAHPGDLRRPALGQTVTGGLSSLNRSPPAPPVKITAQKFQRKVATSITAPRSGFLLLLLFVFYISVHFSLMVGSQAQRDREVTKRTSKGPAEPLQVSVYIHVPAVLRAGTAWRGRRKLEQRHRRIIKTLNVEPKRTPEIMSRHLLAF